MNVLHSCSLLALSLLAGAPPRPPEPKDILPPAQAGIRLEVQGDAAISMLDVLREYERVTGVHLLISREFVDGLAKQDPGLQRSLTMPREQVHTLVESLLTYGGYRTILLHAQEPVVVGLRRFQNPQPLITDAVFVDVSELDRVARHPALLCWTSFALEALDAGEILKTLGPLWTDSNIRLMCGISGTSQIVLIGSGAEVSDRARYLIGLDRSMRRKPDGQEHSDAGGAAK